MGFIDEAIGDIKKSPLDCPSIGTHMKNKLDKNSI
jgi:hypothetical protein